MIPGEERYGWMAALLALLFTPFTGMLYAGAAAVVAGLSILLVWALLGAGDAIWILPPWILINIGFGLRAPTGYFYAIKAAHGDDARGSALVMLIFLGMSSAATAAVAPVITLGLVPVAAVALAIAMLGIVVMLLLPALRAEDAGRAARLSSVDGDVRIVQDGQVIADPALVNTPLFEGSQIVTGDDGRAELQIDDGSVARLSPNSSPAPAPLPKGP